MEFVYNAAMKNKPRKYILRMLMRVLRLLVVRPAACEPWVEKSYDRISGGYDQAWTTHMRDLTAALIDRLDPKQGDRAADLTCR